MICTISKHAAEAKGYADALMLDYRGYVAEATGANIFFVQGRRAAHAEPGLLPQRHHAPVGDRHRQGARQIPVIERHIEPEEMSGFSECFLTGSAAEVTPVSEIGPYRFKPGTLTETLMNAYADEVRGVAKLYSSLDHCGEVGEEAMVGVASRIDPDQQCRARHQQRDPGGFARRGFC